LGGEEKRRGEIKRNKIGMHGKVLFLLVSSFPCSARMRGGKGRGGGKEEKKSGFDDEAPFFGGFVVARGKKGKKKREERNRRRPGS